MYVSFAGISYGGAESERKRHVIECVRTVSERKHSSAFNLLHYRIIERKYSIAFYTYTTGVFMEFTYWIVRGSRRSAECSAYRANLLMGELLLLLLCIVRQTMNEWVLNLSCLTESDNEWCHRHKLNSVRASAQRLALLIKFAEIIAQQQRPPMLSSGMSWPSANGMRSKETQMYR